ncbi:hypothetical protein CLOSB_52540 [Clostridium beijerinckii]|nr:hypothetical protein CLOSB_52540 [Clostridium beijerinckii]
MNNALNPLIIPVAASTPKIGVNTPDTVSMNLLNGLIFSSDTSSDAPVLKPPMATTSAKTSGT